MRYSTGKNYCEKCYKELTGQNIDKEELAKLESKNPFGLAKINKIKELEAGQSNINLVVEVIDFYEKKVNKNGKTLRLGKFKIKDDSGEIELILWEDMIDLLSIGDNLIIKKAFIRSFMNQEQVTLGKEGELINLKKEKSLK
ncbi:MAG: hypothetical protein JXA99_03815 [Candidatus Lokiarchaeota archaeon]|nr:hypothetical protein [Candidatus Lokiarchaeota archaeon]